MTTIDRTCRRCDRHFVARTIEFDGRMIVAGWYCDPCLTEITQEETEARNAEAADTRRSTELRRIADARRFLNVPPLFADARLSAVKPYGSEEQQKRIMRAGTLARRIVGELSSDLTPTPFVAFLGAAGTGKTMLTWAIAAELAEFGIKGRVVRLSSLVRDLRASWRDKDGPSEDTRLAAYVDVPFLGIDEVSRHAFYGQQIHQHLFDVINARLEYQRPTVLTSNESQEGLAEILGPALMDRLATGGIVNFGTESFRRLPKNGQAA